MITAPIRVIAVAGLTILSCGGSVVSEEQVPGEGGQQPRRGPGQGAWLGWMLQARPPESRVISTVPQLRT
jgi:hypothetical protein